VQIDLDQAAFKRHDVAWSLGQGIDTLRRSSGVAMRSGRRRSMDSDTSARASSSRPRCPPGSAETVFLSIALFTALSGARSEPRLDQRELISGRLHR
jgi:hypothetical protein